MGGGQFCTNPGLLITLAGATTERFLGAVADRYKQSPPATLFSEAGLASLQASIDALQNAGAQLVVGGAQADGPGFKHNSTLLRVDAATFLQAAEALQTEAFGNCTQVVVCQDVAEAQAVISQLEGILPDASTPT